MTPEEFIRSARGTIAIAGGRTEGVPQADAVLETASLKRIVEYKPADQVVSVECGVTLAALQAELAQHKQRLALDPAHAEKATIGGIVAANSFGPLRTRYGSVRDLIIGVEIIRADGSRAKGGGKVVKNVAGFDLPKLMCGSRGTLAMIATATFRVHPLPEEVRTVVARAISAQDVLALVRRVRELQLEPAAMMAVFDRRYDVFVRFEGFGAGVRQQTQRLALPETDWPALQPRGAFRFGALPAQLPEVERAIAGKFCWYPTLGLGFTDVSTQRFPGWFGAQQPSSPELHAAVKQRLDPQGRFPA